MPSRRYRRRAFLAFAGATAVVGTGAGGAARGLTATLTLDPARYDRRAAYDVRPRLLGRWRTAVDPQ